MTSEAYLSECRTFRYWLLRVWNIALPIYAVIGCNPSTADETVNDPTIRKVMGFGTRLGFGGALMLNVGGFRATDPRRWAAASDPFGAGNSVECLQAYLIKFAPRLVVAAWGRPCMLSDRGRRRAATISREILGMKCWGRNGDGSPRHPLMLAYSTELEPFEASHDHR